MDIPDDMDVQEKNSSFPLPLAGAILAVMAVGAGIYFVKKNKGKKK